MSRAADRSFARAPRSTERRGELSPLVDPGWLTASTIAPCATSSLVSQPKLAGRATPLAVQAGFGKTGFLCADFGDGLGAGLDLVGDGVQKAGAIFAA